MSRAKSIVGLLIVAATTTVLLLLFVPRDPSPAEGNAIRADGVMLNGYSADGTATWEIRAEIGSLEEEVGTLDAVSIRFYDENQPPLVVRGDRLVRGASENRLQGDVLVEREDGLRLETENLTWDESIDRLDSGPVRVAFGDVTLTAGRFSYDLATRRARFEDGVEATVSRETPLEIRGDRAEERDDALVVSGADDSSVTIVIEDQGEFACQDLETDLDGTFIELSGGVEGTLSGARISAERVRLEDEGLRASRGVVLRLDLDDAVEAVETEVTNDA